MTDRDKQRNVCIVEMLNGYFSDLGIPIDAVQNYLKHLGAMTAAFDALHGIARVNAIEATNEMVKASRKATDKLYLENTTRSFSDTELLPVIFATMSAAGDLTNPPERTK